MVLHGAGGRISWEPVARRSWLGAVGVAAVWMIAFVVLQGMVCTRRASSERLPESCVPGRPDIPMGSLAR
jgi:hypothetical protein